MRTSCTVSRRPSGPLAPPTRPAHPSSRSAPARLASNAGRLARKARPGAAEPRGSRPGRGGFDKGTLAAALIGHCGQARSQPDSQTSVRAAAPCQIRHSVCPQERAGRRFRPLGMNLWQPNVYAVYCQERIDVKRRISSPGLYHLGSLKALICSDAQSSRGPIYLANWTPEIPSTQQASFYWSAACAHRINCLRVFVIALMRLPYDSWSSSIVPCSTIAWAKMVNPSCSCAYNLFAASPALGGPSSSTTLSGVFIASISLLSNVKNSSHEPPSGGFFFPHSALSLVSTVLALLRNEAYASLRVCLLFLMRSSFRFIAVRLRWALTWILFVARVIVPVITTARRADAVEIKATAIVELIHESMQRNFTVCCPLQALTPSRLGCSSKVQQPHRPQTGIHDP